MRRSRKPLSTFVGSRVRISLSPQCKINSTMSILLKRCQIISAEDNSFADILIENEKITAIQPNLNIEAEKIIDANDFYVIPGGIDVHTHLDMPLGNIKSSDNFETGTIAAAFGGTTSILDFATQSRGMKIYNAFELWMKKAEGNSVIDFGFHMIVTSLNDDDLYDLKKILQHGVTSIKLFMAYPGVLMVDNKTILNALEFARDNGALICLHAEDGNEIEKNIQGYIVNGNTGPEFHVSSRPAITESTAVEYAINLAKQARSPIYIVHLSTADALNKIIEARKNQIPIYAETCPQYLFCSLDDLNKRGFENAKYVFTPPPREKWNQEKLWEGIQNNFIQIISTDHCPFNLVGQKEIGKNDFTKIPNGCPGIENRIQLLFDEGVNKGRISLNKWVEIISTNPAKMFGLYPRKGTIEVGSDADIVIWNPKKENIISTKTHHMAVDYNLYEGRKVIGDVEFVISRGEVIIENNKFVGKKGRGVFLKRNKIQSLGNK